LRVLYITSEWPTKELHWIVPFIVRQVRYLREAGVDIEVFPFRGNRKLSNYRKIYADLHHRLRTEHFDLVHAQFGHSGFLAAVPKRVPLVVTFQGSELHGIYTSKGRYHRISPFLRLGMQFVAIRADEVIVVSDHMKRFLPRSDYHVIPGGIDLDLFQPMPQAEARQKLDLPPEKPLVLFVGSPQNAVKRHHLAEATVRKLQETVEAELVVASGVPPDHIPIYMNAADVLLVTSKHEGSPNIVKESMACNLPIISVDVGDVRLRLRNVTESTVVPSEDPATLAQALADVLSRRQRSNGREEALKLNEASLVQKQIAVYEKAIGKNAAARKTP